jgi:isocitrate/isopropylmalate dehydrogenase
MLEELGLPECATILNAALEHTLADGASTADLGGNATCSEFGERVRENLRIQLARNDAHLELLATNRGCCG